MPQIMPNLWPGSNSDREQAKLSFENWTGVALISKDAMADFNRLFEKLNLKERENFDLVSKLPGNPLQKTFKSLRNKYTYAENFYGLNRLDRKTCMEDFLICASYYVKAIPCVDEIIGAMKSDAKGFSKKLCSENPYEALRGSPDDGTDGPSQLSSERCKAIAAAIMTLGAQSACGIAHFYTEVVNKLHVTEYLVNVRRSQLKDGEEEARRQKEKQDLEVVDDDLQRGHALKDLDSARASLSLHAGGPGGSAGATIPLQRTEIDRTLQEFSRVVVKDKLLHRCTQEKENFTLDKVLSKNFLRAHPDYVVAHNCGAGTVEVYRLRTTTDLNHGMLQQVMSFGFTRRLPRYFKGRQQKFLVNQEGIQRHTDLYVDPVFPKSRSRDKRYSDVNLVAGEMETIITNALAQEGLMGGWWETLQNGQPPCTGIPRNGYRSGDLAFAVAGLTCWISCQEMGKSLRWLEFPDVTLKDSRNLIIGSCLLSADPKMHQQKSKESVRDRLDVWANQESVFWRKVPMWG